MFTAMQLTIPLLFLVFELLPTVAFTITSYVPKRNFLLHSKQITQVYIAISLSNRYMIQKRLQVLAFCYVLGSWCGLPFVIPRPPCLAQSRLCTLCYSTDMFVGFSLTIYSQFSN
jgi:hypothetical protein